MSYQKARIVWVKAVTKARRLLAAVPSRTIQVARKTHGVVCTLEPWGILVALLGLGIALVSILVDLDDRQSERTFRAWQIALAESSAGSSRSEAIEYLNREFGGSFCGPLVAQASMRLTGNSRRMCLIPSKARESLAEINLVDSDLAGADLRRADLTNADLTNAILRRADLRGADLTNAVLRRADLTNAILMNADLTYANLMNADLTQAQLDAACGILPPWPIPRGLLWRSRPCPENAQ